MRSFAGVLLLFIWATSASGYSVLSHEAAIDALWDLGLRSALLARFPNASPEQIKTAHSYAYGGAILQDMGYYPHGNGYFSDLTHYARAADFILTLIADSQTLDEYAFALGALSHYATDNDGHRLATNVGEPRLYPKLKRKFGNVVTYEDAPYKHLQTEYAFDVEEVFKGNYAPAAYHDFIGFNVASSLVERAFRETYGFEITEVIPDFDKSVGSFRYTLSKLIPFFTRVAWANHEAEIRKAQPGTTKSRFLYLMHRSSYEREWGKRYEPPSLFDRFIAFLVRILPPIGEIQVLKFRALTPPVENLFRASFDKAAQDYRAQINAVEAHSLQLANTNFDVGVVTQPGQYKLQDETYAYWLDSLARSHFVALTPAVARDILKYYSDLNAPITTKKNRKDWHTVLAELDQLRATPAAGQIQAADPPLQTGAADRPLQARAADRQR